MRELMESDAYRRSASKLTLALGKTIHGEPFVSDLATMPHLLIAGSTGTGKSVSVNAMLSSILFRASPDDVRLIMIDPKRLELGMYEDIPHLLTPVVVDPKQASNALALGGAGDGGALQDARRRRRPQHRAVQPQPPAGAGQRTTARSSTTTATRSRPLPSIVVLIDELADLMMVAGNEVEESIARLAQMARAVGIHLILATQRPSVDVITGLIKANLPARISFRVSSKIDSRTILDGNGAEQLLGKGDMLYLPPASSRFVRLHGPYISEQESARLASFLRKQGKPTYDETITADDKQASGRSRVREGRPLRRGGANRRIERPGLDLVPAAAVAHRLQPRRAAGGHDGGRGPGVGRGGRQGARSAGEEGLLRRGRRAAAIARRRRTSIGWTMLTTSRTRSMSKMSTVGTAAGRDHARGPASRAWPDSWRASRWCAWRSGRRCGSHPSSRASCRATLAVSARARWRPSTDASTDPRRRRRLRTIRAAFSDRAATATTRCGRRATCRCSPISGSGSSRSARGPAASYSAEVVLSLELAAGALRRDGQREFDAQPDDDTPASVAVPACSAGRRRRPRQPAPAPAPIERGVSPRLPPSTAGRVDRRDRGHPGHHPDAACRRRPGQHRDGRRDRLPPGAARQPPARLLRPEERAPGRRRCSTRR